MFKAIHHTEAARTFNTYAEAYRFVMREGVASRLWQIRAASIDVLKACKAEKEQFHGSTRNMLAA